MRLAEERLKESINERQAEIPDIKLKDSIRNLKIRDTVKITNKCQGIFEAKRGTTGTVVVFLLGKENILLYLKVNESRFLE